MRKTPVHHISEFHGHRHEGDFYVNSLEKHVLGHAFIDEPHKHDFYLCVIFTKGSGTHFIDFKKYRVKPGMVFFLAPGQLHHWNLSKDTKGFIFFHSAALFDLQYRHLGFRDFPFYRSLNQLPFLQMNAVTQKKVVEGMKNLQEESEQTGHFHSEKICALITLVYIALARSYSSEREAKVKGFGYLDKIRKLETLIEAQYKTDKSPSVYAEQMGMTRKHLNRICRESLNKTVSEVIADRVVLEAKRLLVQGGVNAGQVADKLGYEDHSYFNRFFRKHAGMTPMGFLRKG